MKGSNGANDPPCFHSQSCCLQIAPFDERRAVVTAKGRELYTLKCAQAGLD